MAVRRRSDNGVCVLVSEKTAAHLPVCEINPTRSIHSTLKKYMTEIFGSDLPPHRRKSKTFLKFYNPKIITLVRASKIGYIMIILFSFSSRPTERRTQWQTSNI